MTYTNKIKRLGGLHEERTVPLLFVYFFEYPVLVMFIKGTTPSFRKCLSIIVEMETGASTDELLQRDD